MAATFVRVRDPEQVADLELAGLLWCQYRSPGLGVAPVPQPREGARREWYVTYWRESGTLWSDRWHHYGYMAED